LPEDNQTFFKIGKRSSERNHDPERGKGATMGHSAPGNKPVYIVGIGASAGGLNALEQFFDNMPPDSGMAFVVIQHLSPDFKSQMESLLAHDTRMPIHTVADDTTLAPDNIYLLPPMSQLTVNNWKLHRTGVANGRHVELPIDMFFSSLAEEAGPRAVGIILSGTGKDGSHGIQAIHDQGGLVIVQSPTSAEFDGMPRSAIDTDKVDFILPPEQIPTLLMEYIINPTEVHTRSRHVLESLEDEAEFREIFALLRQGYNLDFSNYKRATVGRRIRRRMDFLKIVKAADYVSILSADRNELDALYRDLLIGVTDFFRDPPAFQYLESNIVPQLFSSLTPGEDLRVWSAGCATGEEAYSLGILLRDKAAELNFTGGITVFATDMHKHSLDVAAQGLYCRERLTNVSADRLQRHFHEEGPDVFRVNAELRKMLVFAPHNLITDPPFSKIGLICCRNLLIYLRPETQKRVISLFNFALNGNGFLFLGSSEGLGDLAGEFEMVSNQHKLFRKIRDQKLFLELHSSPTGEGLNAPTPHIKRVQPRLVSLDRQVLHDYDTLLGKHIPPGILIDEKHKIIHYFGNVAQYLKTPEGRAESDALLMTDDNLHVALSTSLQRVEKTGLSVVTRNIRIKCGGEEYLVDLTVDPIPDEKTLTVHYHVCFERVRPVEHTPPPDMLDHADSSSFEAATFYRLHVADLETELQTARENLTITQENLRASIEELQVTVEEYQVTNEELQATNEELRTSNEELHSTNEELHSVNSELGRTNIELKKLTIEHANLLNSIDSGMIFLDRQICIRNFNPAIASFFKLLPQDIGRPIDHIAYQLPHQEQMLADLRQVLEGGLPIEKEVVAHDGRWLLKRIVPFRNETGELEGGIITFTDLSRIKAAEQKVNRLHEVLKLKINELHREVEERRRAEEEADRASRAKSEFLAAMSHEIRTPMHGIAGMAELLKETPLNDQQQECVRVINSSSALLLSIINDILDISRIEAGRMKIEASPFNLREVVGRAIDMLAVQARNKGLRFEQDYAGGLPCRFLGDSARIEQVLVNLVGNAVKFTEEGLVRVTVSCVEANSSPFEVKVSVEDSGPGIPDDKLQLLFQKFSPLSLESSKMAGGTGLGLAISKELVEMMGGRIGVETEEGKGSTFWFSLPLPTYDEPDNTSESRLTARMVIAAIEPLAKAGLNRCLLVDDNTMNNQLLAMMLEKYGLKTETVSNGLEAVEMLEASPFDLVFMDCRMPVMDGFEATRLIREREGDANHTPIIAITADASSEDCSGCLEAGMDYYLSKPFDLQRLFRTLLTWAELKKEF
jgi:signal transduction histidine kinase/chemotaxis methyl-accepting protein methylase/chemotaxis response regulator CheB